MPKLDSAQRNQAIGMLAAGIQPQRVATAIGVHHSSVYRLVNKLAVTGSVDDRQRAGRPRVTTPRQDRAIRNVHLQNRFTTAAETAKATYGTC